MTVLGGFVYYIVDFIFMIAVITCGVLTGKKLRERKDKKNQIISENKN